MDTDGGDAGRRASVYAWQTAAIASHLAWGTHPVLLKWLSVHTPLEPFALAFLGNAAVCVVMLALVLLKAYARVAPSAAAAGHRPTPAPHPRRTGAVLAAAVWEVLASMRAAARLWRMQLLALFVFLRSMADVSVVSLTSPVYVQVMTLMAPFLLHTVTSVPRALMLPLLVSTAAALMIVLGGASDASPGDAVHTGAGTGAVSSGTGAVSSGTGALGLSPSVLSFIGICLALVSAWFHACKMVLISGVTKGEAAGRGGGARDGDVGGQGREIGQRERARESPPPHPLPDPERGGAGPSPRRRSGESRRHGEAELALEVQREETMEAAEAGSGTSGLGRGAANGRGEDGRGAGGRGAGPVDSELVLLTMSAPLVIISFCGMVWWEMGGSVVEQLRLLPPAAWLVIACYGVGIRVCAQLLQIYCVKRLGPAPVTFLLPSRLVAAVAAEYFLIDHQLLSWVQMCGVALMLVALFQYLSPANVASVEHNAPQSTRRTNSGRAVRRVQNI